MRNMPALLVGLLLSGGFFATGLSAETELTLETVTKPAPNNPDEPLAESFSLAAATRFLDQASLDWWKSHQCFACHSNYSYLFVRPAVPGDSKAHQQLRGALEQLVEQRWPEKGPRWDAEVVMSAAALALGDRATTGRLHPATRKALERMWTVQRDDGGFNWLKCNWPPMESDDYYGAIMGAIAAGAAPDQYAKTAASQEGLKKMRAYFKQHPLPTLHHRAMLMWASGYLEGLMTDQERADGVKQLLALQKGDGGWALANLGDWKRSDGKPQDTETSDGYATGFVVYVLRCCGVAADEAPVQKGIAWIKANQRASGRWFTRSLNKDSKHLISHAGSAFAVLALVSCGE